MSDAASEIVRLRAALAAETARARAAEAELAQARALASCTDAMIQELKLEIAKLRRDKYGVSSERRARLIDQLELQLEELEAAAAEDALAAEQVAGADATSNLRAFTRREPVRKPFPEHLPRERVVVEALTRCACCGSDRIVKMGEDVTETLEVIPRQWVAPLVHDLHDWMRAERARMSKHNPVTKAINYMLDGKGRWEAFTTFLEDGRLCLTNNAAERALRGIALGRKSWLFAGSERGSDRAAFMYTLIVSAKMNDIDPQAWMADVLARLPDMPMSRVHELLPWHWKAAPELKRIAA